MSAESEVAEIRDALERADADLVTALARRAEAVQAFRTLREQNPEAYLALPPAEAVISRALELNESFPEAALQGALREILGACARILAPVRVSIPAPVGAFGRIAASRHFGSSAEIAVCEDVARVFDDVERRRSSFGVVPFETSSEGALAATLEALAVGEARVCAEVTVPCTFDLVSAEGQSAAIEKVHGTSVALAACRNTLEREFPGVALLDVGDSVAAMDQARDDRGAAAVVTGWSEDDPKGLRRLRERVEDEGDVETRFVVIGHERPRRTGHDRTLLALAVSEDPGSLHRALEPLANRGINLTRIESRVARAMSWRYLFILELDGHMTDRSVLTAVEEVRGGARHLKVLGSYPRPR